MQGGDGGEMGGRRHCLLCPHVYRIELKFPLCSHFVEGLCSLRELCESGQAQGKWRRRERERERETVRERMGEGGRMSLFRALIMNKTDSRGLVCV